MKYIRSLPTALWLSLGAAVLAITLMIAPSSASVALATPVDACSGVPDQGPNFNFTAACQAHDNCYAIYGGGTYSATKELQRAACDRAFYNDMNAWCNTALFQHQISLLGYSACRSRAQFYYQGVRTFGGLFFYNQQQPT